MNTRSGEHFYLGYHEREEVFEKIQACDRNCRRCGWCKEVFDCDNERFEVEDPDDPRLWMPRGEGRPSRSVETATTSCASTERQSSERWRLQIMLDGPPPDERSSNLTCAANHHQLVFFLAIMKEYVLWHLTAHYPDAFDQHPRLHAMLEAIPADAMAREAAAGHAG